MKHFLGCNPCPDDACGDTSLDDLLGASRDQLTAAPESLDLSAILLEMRDQRKAGTCVGFGVSQAATNVARQAGFPNFGMLSALGTYMQGRAMERALRSPGDGTTIDATLRGLASGGYLFETEMPYDETKRHQGFRLGQGQAALRRCGLRSHRISPSGSLEQFKATVKQLLSTGKGVVGGWQIDQPMEDWTPDQPPWDGMTQRSEGGHCLCVLDYPKGNPRLVNSWGIDAGDGGLYTFTWNAVRKATSLWAIDFVP